MAEVSELMTAAALMYPVSKLNEYVRQGKDGIINLILDARDKIVNNKFEIYFANNKIKDDFLKDMKREKTSDMVQGISAALATRKFMKNTNGKVTVYMTGDSWPKEVEQFRISAYGFKDYNSSDFIVTSDHKEWFGISLKKKKAVKDPDPTLINKAFSSLFEGVTDLNLLKGKSVKDLEKELEKGTREYFVDLLIESVEKEYFRYSDMNKSQNSKFSSLSELKSFANNENGSNYLFKGKDMDKNIFHLKYAYINMKGSVHPKFLKDHPEGYNWDPGRGELQSYSGPSMRNFVNSELGKSNNKLWKTYIDIINDYAEAFGDALINIILKTKLYQVKNDGITSETFNENTFKFALITGIGKITQNKVSLSVGKTIPLKTTLCGLSRILVENPQPYKVVLNTSKRPESDDEEEGAAKVYLILRKGKVDILDLELRYKGSFTAQPQFQGFLTKQFKELLHKECSGRNG